jgi:hypothetical protein
MAPYQLLEARGVIHSMETIEVAATTLVYRVNCVTNLVAWLPVVGSALIQTSKHHHLTQILKQPSLQPILAAFN